jgi:hypothetical protein
MRARTFLGALLLAGLAVSTVTGQPATRRATTITAIRAYSGYYHQQTVMVLGEIKGTGDRITIGTDEGAIGLIARDAPREGRVEARGQLLDVGRMSPDDPRLIPFNLLDRVRTTYQERWPKPGEEIVLLLSGTVPPPAAANATTPPLRAVAMDPLRFEGQRVTITGQFRGRNLFGDSPEAPSQNRYQFVLRSGDAAIWVMGLEPKGKGFNFDPARRLDSGRWVHVQGTVHSAKGVTWLDGTSIELAPTPEDTTEVVIDLPPPPPVEILFTAPSAGETDVRSTERIRMQLSRDLNPETLKGRVKLTYVSAQGDTGGATEIEFTTNYVRENRALEIRPVAPLERFRGVRLDVAEGVKGTDGGPMAPFTLTFTVGGS